MSLFMDNHRFLDGSQSFCRQSLFRQSLCRRRFTYRYSLPTITLPTIILPTKIKIIESRTTENFGKIKQCDCKIHPYFLFLPSYLCALYMIYMIYMYPIFLFSSSYMVLSKFFTLFWNIPYTMRSNSIWK